MCAPSLSPRAANSWYRVATTEPFEYGTLGLASASTRPRSARMGFALLPSLQTTGTSPLASGSEDGAVRILDSRAQEASAHVVFRGHADWDTSLAFSPAGRDVASGSADWTIRVWDVARGVARHPFRGHVGAVLCVAYTPDGRRIASGSEDTAIRIWDVKSGGPRCVGTPNPSSSSPCPPTSSSRAPRTTRSGRGTQCSFPHGERILRVPLSRRDAPAVRIHVYALLRVRVEHGARPQAVVAGRLPTSDFTRPPAEGDDELCACDRRRRDLRRLYEARGRVGDRAQGPAIALGAS